MYRQLLALALLAPIAAGCGGESSGPLPPATGSTTSTTESKGDVASTGVESSVGDDLGVTIRSGSNSGSGGLVVDVAGAVRRPGVYRMPAGARVHEAIEAAGGTTVRADTSSLNRAAPVVDGQQVLVPMRGSQAASPTGPSDAPATISLNSADADDLDELPGIGPVTAERIVAERDAGGPYASVDDLDRVPGIGPATIESLRGLATT